MRTVLKMAMLAMALALTPAAAQEATHGAPPLAGVWSIGDAKRCDAGPAWVFLADGYYAEVQLPAGPIGALGIWRDEGAAIAYTHTHLPFAGLEATMPVRRLRIIERTAERIAAIAPRGNTRIFHRCPPGTLQAPAGKDGH